jgi:hypothetical protein
MGPLEIIVEDKSDLWEVMKKKQNYRLSAEKINIPPNLRHHLKGSEMSQIEFYPHNTPTPGGFAMFLPTRRLIYITWLGDG